jgi:hypothetical protein
MRLWRLAADEVNRPIKSSVYGNTGLTTVLMACMGDATNCYYQPIAMKTTLLQSPGIPIIFNNVAPNTPKNNKNNLYPNPKTYPKAAR